LLLYDDKSTTCVLEIRFNKFQYEIRRWFTDDKTIETKRKLLNKRCRPYRRGGFLDWYKIYHKIIKIYFLQQCQCENNNNISYNCALNVFVNYSYCKQEYQYLLMYEVFNYFNPMSRIYFINSRLQTP